MKQADLATQWWAGRKGDRAVPIGFWSVNRSEVKQMWEALSHDTPSTPDYEKHINNIVHRLIPQLEKTLRKVVYAEVENLYH